MHAPRPIAPGDTAESLQGVIVAAHMGRLDVPGLGTSAAWEQCENAVRIDSYDGDTLCWVVDRARLQRYQVAQYHIPAGS